MKMRAASTGANASRSVAGKGTTMVNKRNTNGINVYSLLFISANALEIKKEFKQTGP